MTQQTTANASQTNGHASPASASPAAAEQTSLDTLVEQFQSSQTASPAKVAADVISSFRPIAEYVQSEMQTKAAKAIEADVDEAVTYVQGKLENGEKVSKRLVRGVLRDYSIENPDFGNGWENRSDKANWHKQLDAATEVVKSEISSLSKPDNSRTDVERALSTVRNNSTSAPPPVKWDARKAANASDTEYEAMKHEFLSAQAK